MILDMGYSFRAALVTIHVKHISNKLKLTAVDIARGVKHSLLNQCLNFDSTIIKLGP